MSWLLALFAASILPLLAYWMQWRWTHRRMLELAAKMPGPKAWPLIGNSLFFVTKPDEQLNKLQELAEKYGDFIRFWIGPDLNIMVKNPAEIRALLTNPKTSFKGPQYKYIADILGGGLLSGSGPTWRQHRKLAAPNYSKQTVESYTDIFNAEIDNLLETFRNMPKEHVFNIYDSVVKTTTYCVCRTLMGLSKEQTMKLPHLQEVIEKNPETYDIVFSRITKWYLQIDPIFWLSDLHRDMKRCEKIIKEFSIEIVNLITKKTKILTENLNEDFIDPENNAVVKTKNSVVERFITSEIMDDKTIWQETFTVFTTSQEAGAKIASFLLLMMAYHPEYQEKLYAEIKSVITDEDRLVNDENIKQMPYLDMVFKEVIRLFPAGAVIQRSIHEEISCSSGIVPGGSSLLVSIYHLHRDPRYWTNPEAFDPERFSPENSKLRDPNCFIPFSLGPMDCIGRYFAAKLIKTICVRILREYKLTSLKTYKDLKLYIAISVKSLSGYDVIINSRN